MADIFSAEKRSEIMRKVKSTATKPELQVRKFLYEKGLRYRINYQNLPGKPDIYILKYNVAIFIHGCLWHGHDNCKHAALPKSNLLYWQAKIQKNMERDRRVMENLLKLNIETIIVWSCEMDSIRKRAELLEALFDKIRDGR